MKRIDEKSIFILLATSLFWGISPSLDILIFLVISIIIIKASLLNNLIMFIILIPWDMTLYLSGIGSIFRVLQIAIIIKYIFNKKYEKNIVLIDLYIILFVFIYALGESILHGDTIGFNLIINIVVLWIYKKNRKDIIDLSYKWFVVSLVFSIIYGFAHKNFLGGWVEGIGIIPRFSGTSEPNFMAMYTNMAIVIAINLKMKSKVEKAIKLMILYIGLFATLSFSGIAINIVLVAISLIKISIESKSIFKIIKLITICLIIGVTMMVIMPKFSITRGVSQKITNKVNEIKNGNLNQATSGRSSLIDMYLEYWNQEKVTNKIFGNFRISTYDYIIDKYGVEKHSHNTYIDAIFTFGVIGFSMICIYILYKLLSTKDYIQVMLILCSLMSGMGLSLFTARAFIAWLII